MKRFRPQEPQLLRLLRLQQDKTVRALAPRANQDFILTKAMEVMPAGLKEHLEESILVWQEALPSITDATLKTELTEHVMKLHRIKAIL